MPARNWLIRPALLAIAVIAMVAVSTHHVSADVRDFTLINGSDSVVITHVYVSASDVDDWGDDILGADALIPGESIDITFSRFDGEAGKCLYDVKVYGKNGEQGVLYAIDLCSTSTVTFR